MKKLVRIIIPTLLVLVLLGGIGFAATPELSFAQVLGETGDIAKDIPAAANDGDGPISCGITNLFSRDCLLYAFAEIVNLVLKIVASTVWLAGLLLNEAVVSTVLKMGTLVKQMGAIETGWTIFRDLGNIGLIFLMIAIAISTILRLESYGVRKLLARLIIIALLLNFSLFFTRLIIDGSNLLALQFWNQIAIDKTEGDAGLSDAFMQPLQLTSLYDPSGTPTAGNAGTRVNEFEQDIKNGSITFGKIFLIGILGSILLLVTAFVFFAAAILLITRFVILILLMMLAPLAFVAMVAPLTAGYAKKWWGVLLNQSFFAPAYFALTWAALEILSSPAFRTALTSNDTLATGSLSGLLLGNRDLIYILLQFVVVIILMIATLVISKQMGAYGASTVIGWGQTWRKNAQSVIGRNTVGRGMNAAGKGTQYVAALAGGAFAKSGASKVPILGGMLGGAGRTLDAAVSGTFKAGSEMKFGGSKSFLDQKKATEARQKELSQTRTDIEDKAAAKRLDADEYEDVADKKKDIERMNKMTKRQAEKLGYEHLGKEGVAQHLSAEALEAVKKSDEFSEEQAEAVVEAHFAGMSRGLEYPEDTDEYKDARQKLRNLSDKELELYGEARLQNPKIVKELKGSQREAIKKSGKISAEAKGEIKEAWENHVYSILRNDVKLSPEDHEKAVNEFIGKMTPSDIAKFDDDIIQHEEVAKRITPQIAVEMNKEKSVGVKKKIAEAAIKAVGGGGGSKEQKELVEWMKQSTMETPAGILFYKP